MHQALTLIERLLRRHGHVYQANTAAIVRDTFASDPQAACQALNSDEWWNARDAIAAIDLAIDGGFSPRARADAQALRRALVTVFTTMRAYGERNATGELIVMQFQKWHESRI